MSTSSQVSSVVGASADSVFRTLTDIDQLPTWNETMTRVVDRPRTLEPGAEWVVEFHVLGRTWNSRSTLDELDTTSRRFAVSIAHRRRQPVRGQLALGSG